MGCTRIILARAAGNASQDVSVLRNAWRFYGEMRVDGELPEIPRSWVMGLPDDVGPRLISNYVSTVYSHAFIMQPKRYGHLKSPYPELLLEEEDHRFASDRIEVYKIGQDAILENLGKIRPRRNLDQDVLTFLDQRGPITANEAAVEFGKTPRRMRQILSGLEGKEVRKSGSSGPGVRWSRDG